MSSAGLTLSWAPLVLGLLTGGVYLLVGIGLILIFRASKVINFALVEAGVLGASFLALAVSAWHLPYLPAFVVAVIVGGAACALVQAAVVHRLAGVPRVIAVVATVGFAQLFLLVALFVTPSGSGAARYPSPDFLPSISVGNLVLSPAYTAIAIAVPVLTSAALLVLGRTSMGLGIRASASNRAAARLAGIPVSRMTAWAWVGAGMLSTVAVALLLPTRGASVGMTLGPNLLLRALTVAVLARLGSIAVAVPAALGLGVLEAFVAANVSQQGVTDLVLLVVLLVALLLQRDAGGRTAARESWSSVTGFAPVGPLARRRLRHYSWFAYGALLAVLVVVGALVSNADAARLTRVLAMAVIAMGVLVITGLAGQLSLGQVAIAGIAGTASAHIVAATGQFPAGFAAAAAAGALVSLVVGLPALRLRGPFLAATTLALAVVTSGYLLPALLGAGIAAGQPIIAGFAFDTGRRYLILAALVTAGSLLITVLVRRGAPGRAMRAVRDNEDAARAMGLPAARTKLAAFAIAGALAGLGGALLAHAQSVVVAGLFPLPGNTDALASAVIGGLDVVAGPVIGALYVVGVPLFVPLDAAGLAASALGWLLLLLYVPRGLPGLLAPIRAWVVRTAGDAPVSAQGLPRVAVDTEAASGALRPAAQLEVRHASKSYGGVHAVNDINLAIPPGQVVGLIGANGAGKTTLFELIAGSVRADQGQVLLDDVDVSRLPPENRLQHGIVRSFQDAALFPSMTTLECLQIACSRTPGQTRRTRRDRARPHDYAQRFGLEPYVDHRVAELSTGTRRIVELACCAALEPRLLLLDEPAAGVAQAEVEVLAEVLRSLVEGLDCTLIVIEHDVALVRRLADRVIAMHQGSVIADGAADAVLAHPEVVAAYLGEDPVAATRSGSHAPPLGRAEATR